MAKSDTFHCTVITPERKVLDCDASFVAFPAYDGEMGVLTRRAPLVCKLGIGLLRVDTDAGRQTLMVDEGFAQVVENRLTILTERARRAEDVDPAAAEQAVIEARAVSAPTADAQAARRKAVRRAEIELKLARTGKAK